MMLTGKFENGQILKIISLSIYLSIIRVFFKKKMTRYLILVDEQSFRSTGRLFLTIESRSSSSWIVNIHHYHQGLCLYILWFLLWYILFPLYHPPLLLLVLLACLWHKQCAMKGLTYPGMNGGPVFRIYIFYSTGILLVHKCCCQN